MIPAKRYDIRRHSAVPALASFIEHHSITVVNTYDYIQTITLLSGQRIHQEGAASFDNFHRTKIEPFSPSASCELSGSLGLSMADIADFSDFFHAM